MLQRSKLGGEYSKMNQQLIDEINAVVERNMSTLIAMFGQP